MQKLIGLGFSCQQVEEDADRLIIVTAKTLAIQKRISSPFITINVVIIRQDIDLLVLMFQLNMENSNIYFHKVGTSAVKDCFLETESFKHDRNIVAVLHSFTGGDTTSAFTGNEKKNCGKVIEFKSSFINFSFCFNDENSDPNIIARKGCELIASMYSEKSM